MSIDKITGLESKDLPVINEILDNLDRNKWAVKYFSSVPTASDLNPGEIGVYDDKAGIERLYIKSFEGTLMPIEANTGRVVKVVNTQTGAVATGTTTIPDDDTIPQNTEGTEFLTLAITPTNTNNKLLIQAWWAGSPSVAVQAVMALFQDATANALACTRLFHASDGSMATHYLEHYMTAGTTSATTFKIRVGAVTAATMTINGVGGARKYGGVMTSGITITEIKA